MFSGVYLTQVSLLPMGQQDLVDFFLASHLLVDCANFTPALGENNKYIVTYS
jgi:hypothetical protein